MIEALYDRGRYCVTVTGHARSDEPGRDLVCAAASILVLTLAADVNNARESMRRESVIRIVEGDAEIRCAPRREMGSVVSLMLESVCSGFAVLARKYPECVNYRVVA